MSLAALAATFNEKDLHCVSPALDLEAGTVVPAAQGHSHILDLLRFSVLGHLEKEGHRRLQNFPSGNPQAKMKLFVPKVLSISINDMPKVVLVLSIDPSLYTESTR